MSDSILELVKDGPIPVRQLRGRSAKFQIAYARLLQEGQIVEHGLGTRQDPVYVGLPGAVFPQRKMTVRLADVCLLVLAGATEEEARQTLLTAIGSGGEEAVAAICEQASERILDKGLNPVAEVRRAVNRRKAGKPMQLVHDEFDIYNQPLAVEVMKI